MVGDIINNISQELSNIYYDVNEETYNYKLKQLYIKEQQNKRSVVFETTNDKSPSWKNLSKEQKMIKLKTYLKNNGIKIGNFNNYKFKNIRYCTKTNSLIKIDICKIN